MNADYFPAAWIAVVIAPQISATTSIAKPMFSVIAAMIDAGKNVEIKAVIVPTAMPISEYTCHLACFSLSQDSLSGEILDTVTSIEKNLNTPTISYRNKKSKF